MKLINDGRRDKTSDILGKNKILLILIGVVLVTIIVVVILLALVKEQEKIHANTGIKVDGKKINTVQIEDVVIQNGIKYIPIKEIAESLGYRAYNGEYKVESEETNKCYLVNEYESASFFENVNYIYKINVKKEDKKQNYKDYQIQQPVIKINGKLYVSLEGLSIACNLLVKSDTENKKIEIYTLSNLIEEYEGIVTKKGLTMAYESNFENQKAILKGWIIVKDTNGKYGIVDGNGNEILGIKYKNIEYDEYTNSFKVTDSYGKIGVWKIENDTVIQKVSNSYDSIELIDKEKQLYLISSSAQYGVITFEEQFILGIGYDKIGIDLTKFDVENRYIMYNELIPVQKDGKWGIFNLNGENIVPIEYEELGCEISKVSKQKNLKNILMVPEYGLIVLKKEGKYGLINWKGEQIITFALSAVYYSDETGQKVAYMESDGQQYDIVKFLESDGRVPRYEKKNEGDIFSDFENTNIDNNN